MPGGHQGGCTEAGDTALVLEGCGRGGMTCLRTVKVSGAPVERMCWEGRAERMWVGARLPKESPVPALTSHGPRSLLTFFSVIQRE